MHVCARVWNPEDILRGHHHFWLLSSGMESLVGLGLIDSAKLADQGSCPPVSVPPAWDYKHTASHLAFLMWILNLKPGPCACNISASPAEISLSLSSFFCSCTRTYYKRIVYILHHTGFSGNFIFISQKALV